MTDRTVTVGPTGSYSSLAAALAGEQGDISAGSGSGERVIFECQAYVDTTEVSVSGWTVDSGGYVEITTASGAEPIMPMPTDGTRFLLQVSGSGGTGVNAIGISQDYTRVHHIGVENDGGGNGNYGIRSAACSFTWVYSNFVLMSSLSANSNSGMSIGTSWGPSDPIYIYDNVVINNHVDSGSCIATNGRHTGYVYNNTAVCSNTPTGTMKCYSLSGGDDSVRNNVAFGGSVDFSGGPFDATSSNNASSDTTAPGSGSLTSISDPFVDAAGGDYHRADTSSLAGAGADLSTYFTTDFDGLTWSTWDIGATSTETGSAGGSGTATLSASLSAPMATMSADATVAVQASSSLTAPVPTLSANISSGVEVSATLASPMPMVAASELVVVNVSAALYAPMPSVSASAAIEVTAGAAVAAPMPRLSASLGSAPGVRLDATLSSPMPTLAAAARLSVQASAALSAAAPTLSASMTVAVGLQVGLEAPIPTLSAAAAVAVASSATLSAPMATLSAQMLLIGMQVGPDDMTYSLPRAWITLANERVYQTHAARRPWESQPRN